MRICDFAILLILPYNTLIMYYIIFTFYAILKILCIKFTINYFYTINYTYFHNNLKIISAKTYTNGNNINIIPKIIELVLNKDFVTLF